MRKLKRTAAGLAAAAVVAGLLMVAHHATATTVDSVRTASSRHGHVHADGLPSPALRQPIEASSSALVQTAPSRGKTYSTAKVWACSSRPAIASDTNTTE